MRKPAKPRSRGSVAAIETALREIEQRRVVGDLARDAVDDFVHAHRSAEFFGHGFARHPVESRRAMVFEKQGPGCCEIDLKERKVTRTIDAPAGKHFYGHGSFSRGGDTLFIAQSDLTTHEGRNRNPRRQDPSGDRHLPTYGSNPHDCLLIDGGSTLVVTNGGSYAAGSPGNVAFVDVRSQKLLEKLVIPHPQLNAGHVAISKRETWSPSPRPATACHSTPSAACRSARSRDPSPPWTARPT